MMVKFLIDVYIYQRILPHYRVPFFESLYEILKSQGVNLKVVYGKEQPGTVPKSVTDTYVWAEYSKNYYFNVLNHEVVFQSLSIATLRNADLIVLEQANRLLVNYCIFLLKLVTPLKVAFWGHGKNFQAAGKKRFLEWFKKQYSLRVDYWFSYTQESANILLNSGYNAKNITVVKNSIDTKQLALAYDNVTGNQVELAKNKHKITGDNISIYCGGMYEEKRLSFLLSACLKIREHVPDYQAIFIGDGPDAYKVKDMAKKHDWIHVLGVMTGLERVPYFSMSKLFLMPGLVGLAVLDSFALETPMVTVEADYHSPEFAYIRNNENAIISEDNLESYAEAVVTVLTKDSVRQRLIEGCKSSKDEFTIENMAQNFANGVVKALTK